MCLNCGCGQPDERHGKPANIVLDDLRAAARANDQSLEESARHIAEAVAGLPRGPRGDAAAAVPTAGERAAATGLPNPAGERGPAKGERGTPATES